MLTLAIDPGLRKCGVSVWDAGSLVWGGLVHNVESTQRGPRVWEWMAEAVVEAVPLHVDLAVVELPQYDARTRTSGADIWEVVGVAGKLLAALAGRADEVWAVTPGEWAGQVPKVVRQCRLRDKYLGDDSFFAAIEDPEEHNQMDAVDLGHWASKWVLSTEVA